MGKEIPPHSPGRPSHKPRRINLQVGPRVTAVLLWAIWLTSTGQAHADSASRERELRENQAEALKKENQALLKQLAELRKCYKQMIEKLPEGIDSPPELFDDKGDVTEAWKVWLREKFPEEVGSMESALQRIRHEKGPEIAGNVEKNIWLILALWALGGIIAWLIVWFLAWAALPIPLAFWRANVVLFTANESIKKAMKILEKYYDIYFQMKRVWKFFWWIKPEPDIEAWKKVKGKKRGEVVKIKIKSIEHAVTVGLVEHWQAVGAYEEGGKTIFIHINSEQVSIILPPSQIEVM